MFVQTNGMGWVPDHPDCRDLTMEADDVRPRHAKLGQRSVKSNLERVGVAESVKVSTSVDLRQFCSPVETQGAIGSCTAHAGVGCLEYFERRAFGSHLDASRLFLYKVSRDLMGWTGDTGATLRATMAALVLAGVPPEKYWPYDVNKFDVEPGAFLYALADNYNAVAYYRLDPQGITASALVGRVKVLLQHKLPAMFGFSVYSSIDQAASKKGKIPYPSSKESRIGGHAVMAVGYDDEITIANSLGSESETKGALLIRNSWGPDWGEDGYGWLPYAYVLNGLAVDWWSLIKSEWVDTGQFGL